MIRLSLFPQEKVMVGPEVNLRPFLIYSDGVPAYLVPFCYWWEFLRYLCAVRYAEQTDVVVNPFFAIWN